MPDEAGRGGAACCLLECRCRASGEVERGGGLAVDGSEREGEMEAAGGNEALGPVTPSGPTRVRERFRMDSARFSCEARFQLHKWAWLRGSFRMRWA
jgi:hypothetical protein